MGVVVRALVAEAKYACSGPAVGAGAMAWTGSIAIGSGSRKIIECMPDGKNRQRARLRRQPGHGRLSSEGGWQRHLRDPGHGSAHGYTPVSRWFDELLLDGVVGKDYEKGLGSALKSGTHP